MVDHLLSGNEPNHSNDGAPDGGSTFKKKRIRYNVPGDDSLWQLGESIGNATGASIGQRNRSKVHVEKDVLTGTNLSELRQIKISG